MLRHHWGLDPAITFLNHGSFGATPLDVLEQQATFRAQMEAEPVRFFERELEELWDSAQQSLATFVGADVDDVGFVANATTGVNAILRSLRFEPGDELLVTDHGYQACRNTLEFVADRWGARVVVVAIPFPPVDPAQVTEFIVSAVTPQTRLALIDHVTSPTGLVFPVADIVRPLDEMGIDTLVDGAHAPGMLPLDVNGLGAAYYTGNCHKWMCAPKGVGFVHVRSDKQANIVPTVVSHGASSTRTDRSLFREMFAWTGTSDPTAALCLPAAIESVGGLVPGGWNDVRRRNHELVLAGGSLVHEAVGVGERPHGVFIGSMMGIRLPDGPGRRGHRPGRLQDRLLHAHGIEVPIVDWPQAPHRVVRVSAQVYNELGDYEKLAAALAGELESGTL